MALARPHLGRAAEDVAGMGRAGDAVTQYNLGVMYNTGKGVARDYAEAVRWYRKAAEQSYPVAQCWLGIKYWSGEGVAQDYAEAFRWVRKAAEQRYAFAQYSLGNMYELGLRG